MDHDTEQSSQHQGEQYLGPSYLGQLLSPSIISILLSYFDTFSLTKLEECCYLLRSTVISTKEYKRRVRRQMNSSVILGTEVQEQQTDVESSFYYKCKLVQFLNRFKTGEEFYISDHRAD